MIAGVAIAYPQRGQSVSMLIEAAASALYLGNQTGRNRIHPKDGPWAAAAQIFPVPS